MSGQTPASISWVIFSLDVISSVLGLLASFLMCRRYTSNLVGGIICILAAPLMWIIGRGNKVSEFYESYAAANYDVPISLANMTLGLSLLFWAFVLQLASKLVSRLFVSG